jgi:hypothetical protein
MSAAASLHINSSPQNLSEEILGLAELDYSSKIASLDNSIINTLLGRDT